MHTGAGKVKALLGKPGAMDQHSILEELKLLVTSLLGRGGGGGVLTKV